MENKVYFKETQRITQWWIWALLGVISLGIFTPIYKALISNQNLSEGQWIGIVILILIISFLFSIRLETRIQKEGIYVRFVPFLFKTKFIPWQELESAFVRIYSPLKEYGGWGWRIGGNGQAYNVQGNEGLQLKFKSKKALLIGTQKPEELSLVLSELYPFE